MGKPLSNESFFLVLVLSGFAVIGFIRDVSKTQVSILFPYQILLIIFGAYWGIIVPHAEKWVEVLLTVSWPLLIIYCLKLASIVFEMPFLLCLGSGVTFLLFFSDQAATPPEAAIFTICLVSVCVFYLAFLILGKRGFSGDSGLFALGYLLAAISMIGKSKSLLLFGLLVPSMVIFYPLVLFSLILMISYLGNELYQSEGKERKISFKWMLPRERLIVLSGTVFLGLNFLVLLFLQAAYWYGYLALVILFGASLASFIKAFAKREPVALPEIGSRIKLLGYPLEVIDTAMVLDKVAAFLESPKGLFHILTADSLAILRATRDKSFSRIFHRASLVLPDGAGLLWAADFLGTPLHSRIPGVGLVSDLCRIAANRGWAVFFIGGRPGIAEKAVEKLVEKFPGLKVSGVNHGFFHEGSRDEESILKNLKKLRPDIVLVALGVPRQENFIQRLRDFTDKAVAVGVGGSFDVISGSIPRAPEIMQRFALEWLFRLWKEPKRFGRIMQIPWFVLAVIKAKWQEEEFVV